MSIDLTAIPTGATESKSIFGGNTIQTCKVNVGDSSYEENIPEDSVDITIGVFIDGTLNNRDNVNARLAYNEANDSNQSQTYKNVIDNIDEGLRGSYENDLSNVARMEAAYKKVPSGEQLQDMVYTEGIGSVIGEADNEEGMGLGTGPTGVLKKVERACILAAEKIATLFDNNSAEKINRLQIDVFGFSRGAAAARNFVHEITRRIGDERTVFDDTDDVEEEEKEDASYEVDYGELGVQLESKGIKEIRQLVIRFVGLYETVASYGVIHTNDTSDLNLKAISNSRHVFQLVAQDEHRENFVITNINSAGSNGVEKHIPGVHSDIGGGYTDNAREVNLVIKEPSTWSRSDRENAEAMRNQLINQGWYKTSELSINNDDELLVNRTVASKKYSFIPLHIMVEYAMKKEVLFEFSLINDSYRLDESSGVTLNGNTTYSTNLQSIKDRLDKHVYEGVARMNLPDDESMLRLIRANYIHTSAHYNDKVNIYGVMYPPHKPHDSYLTRDREDNNG